MNGDFGHRGLAHEDPVFNATLWTGMTSGTVCYKQTYEIMVGLPSHVSVFFGLLSTSGGGLVL